MATVTHPDRLMASSEVATDLRVTVSTVNRWAASGKLPYTQRLPGTRGAYLFRRSDVDALALTLRQERCPTCGALRQVLEAGAA